ASIVYGFAMFAMSLVVPQLLELPTATGYGLGQSILTAGLVLAPNGLIMMATAPLSARISRTMGPKVTLMTGAFVVAVGYALTTVMMGQVWQILIASCVIGIGVGLGYGAMPSLIMGAVPMSETAAANSLNTLMRSIGTSVSSAFGGVILANMTMSLGPFSVPSQAGFRVVLIVAGAASLVAAVIAAFLPGRKPAAGPVAAAVPVDVPAAGQISGVLRTAVGAAVPYGVVTVTGTDGTQVSRAPGDGDGRYTVTGLPPGHYTVIVTAAGFEAAAALVSLNGSGAVQDFALSGGGAVSGSVRRSGGEPVAGATVTATGAAGHVVGGTVSADDGTFHLTGIPAGPTTFVAQVDNHQPPAVTVLVDGREPTVVDLVAESSGRLYGTVTGEDGRPLAHAAIAVTGTDGVLVAACTAGEDGDYEVPGLAPGRYTVVTSLYAPTVREISLTGGGQVTVDLDLTTTDTPVA
ncbi:MAG TPA: MFS transporter, partial [Amycolatopsis sp.]|nr:MFS transporter [Amycolatopsis sp.]